MCASPSASLQPGRRVWIGHAREQAPPPPPRRSIGVRRGDDEPGQRDEHDRLALFQKNTRSAGRRFCRRGGRGRQLASDDARTRTSPAESCYVAATYVRERGPHGTRRHP
jgi:hypothetical protein